MIVMFNSLYDNFKIITISILKQDKKLLIKTNKFCHLPKQNLSVNR